MRSYFARHTERLLIRDEDLLRFWEEGKVAIHYPGETGRDPDTRSLDPEDYSGTGKTAMRRLRELGEDGGYVWAESRAARGGALIGKVEPGTAVELERALWEVSGSFPGRRSGDAAVLKALRLEPSSVRRLGPADCVGLRAGRPRQGTLVRWHCGTRLADLVEGREPGEEWPNLSTAQAEAACAEYLRWQEGRDGMPRLRHLLLPVGRTLIDVDLYGTDEGGRTVFAQVTYHARGEGPANEKVGRLKAYGGDGARLVFFGRGAAGGTEEGVEFVSVEEEVLPWLRGQPPGYRGRLFGC